MQATGHSMGIGTKKPLKPFCGLVRAVLAHLARETLKASLLKCGGDEARFLLIERIPEPILEIDGTERLILWIDV